MDRWQSQVVVCRGGLDVSTDVLTQGTSLTGTARVLQNYEPAVEGGYRRISGYTLWDEDEVPGEADTPILGVKVALDGVFAVRLNDAEDDNALYYSTGNGWTGPLNTRSRDGEV